MAAPRAPPVKAVKAGERGKLWHSKPVQRVLRRRCAPAPCLLWAYDAQTREEQAGAAAVVKVVPIS